MKKTLLAIIISLSTLYGSANAQSVFRGSMEPIPEPVAKAMQGYTWHKGCPVPLDQLSYLTVSYWGYDHQPHEGHLIVLNILAGETLQIFQKLYQMKFPIEKMVLPEKYQSKDDFKSTDDNNTYGFFCREDEQSPGDFSPHSYGIAFDINPVYNPARIAHGKIAPAAGKKYFNRKFQHDGMIDEKVVAVFTQSGWKWGGYWSEAKKDYMHFQKDIDENYSCPYLISHVKK